MFPCLAILSALARSEARGSTCAKGILFSPCSSPNWNAHNPTTASDIEASIAIADFLIRRAGRVQGGMFFPGRVVLILASGITDAPDGIRAIIGYEQRSVFGYSDADRPSPRVSVVVHKSGQKIFIFAAG